MKKTILVLFMAIQSTSAFASTQVLTCKGVESDEVGESKKATSAVIKIVHPVLQTLLVVNGESGASERASIEIAGLPTIQINGINVTNGRTFVAISGYRADSFSVSAYIPSQQIGSTGSIAVQMTRVTSNNESLFSKLVCNSVLTNSL